LCGLEGELSDPERETSLIVGEPQLEAEVEFFGDLELHRTRKGGHHVSDAGACRPSSLEVTLHSPPKVIAV
jgi:hypothetical protein